MLNILFAVENNFLELQALILDNNDLKILNLPGINGRISYKNIASTTGLTTKSVMTRVDKMFSAKVIERFIVLIIPSIR
ncbi:MAG: AsnC family transcriptional regulator [Nitrososphaeraceae archaeon]